ncbi:MAG: hypothetical protein J7M34_04630, partial [Anaerolineae bacterium]|nr:hypothetical protein [Anaerolineae bacterium]
MTVPLQFFAEHAKWVYATCALIALWYIRVVLRARRERKQAIFSLEREAALQQVYNALAIGIVLLGVIGITYFTSSILLKAVKPLAEINSTTPTLVLPTIM